MVAIYFIGDTHFGHENILKFTRNDGSPLRKFDSIEAHDEHLVECWNSVVRPQDHVYHLGDVAIKTPGLGVLGRLQGHKRLVRGNHDIFPTKKYLQYFDEIYATRILDNMVFSHIPIHPLSINDRWLGNVHGHLHSNPTYGPRYLCVSAEQVDYTPITLEECKARLLAKKHDIIFDNERTPEEADLREAQAPAADSRRDMGPLGRGDEQEQDS